MKKTFILLIAYLFCFHAALFAQTDSIALYLAPYKTSPSDFISKGRTLFLDKFIAQDFQKAKSVLYYVQSEVDTDNYEAFKDAEKWLFYFWTNDFSQILNAAVKYDSIRHLPNYSAGISKITPQKDQLFRQLAERTGINEVPLSFKLTASELKQEEKDFLKIVLTFLPRLGYVLEVQNTLNLMCEDFKKKYPNSRYLNFLTHYIYNGNRLSDWGFGVEFAGSYGLFTKELSQNFNNYGGLLVSFDVYYKRFSLFIRDNIAYTKLKKDLPFGNYVWEKGAYADMVLLQLALGYKVFENKRFEISPFVGYGFTSLSANSTYKTKIGIPSYADIVLGSERFGLSLGANTDIKFRFKNQNRLVGNNGTCAMRLGVAYYPRYTGKLYKGNMINVSLGFVGTARWLKKKYLISKERG